MSVTDLINKHFDKPLTNSTCHAHLILGKDKYSAATQLVSMTDVNVCSAGGNVASETTNASLMGEMKDLLSSFDDSGDVSKGWDNVKWFLNVIVNILQDYPSLIDGTKNNMSISEAIDFIINDIRQELAKRDALHDSTKKSSVDPPELISFRIQNTKALTRMSNIKAKLVKAKLDGIKLSDMQVQKGSWSLCTIQ